MPPGKLVRDDTATLTTTANCPPTLPTANLPASSCSWLSCCTAPVKGPPAGLKHHGSEGRSGPAAGSPDCQTLLSELPRNFQTLLLPALLHCQLPTCLRRLAAGFRAARLRSRDPSQGSNTMAVKDGAGPRPAAQTAKRCFLNCLETSFKPCFYLPSCTANSQLAAGFRAARLRSRDPPAGLKHHGSEGRSGPAAGSPDCQTLLSELPRN